MDELSASFYVAVELEKCAQIGVRSAIRVEWRSVHSRCYWLPLVSQQFCVRTVDGGHYFKSSVLGSLRRFDMGAQVQLSPR